MFKKVNIVYSLYAMIYDVGCSNWSKEKLSLQYEPIHKYRSTYLNIWQRSWLKQYIALLAFIAWEVLDFWVIWYHYTNLQYILPSLQPKCSVMACWTYFSFSEYSVKMSYWMLLVYICFIRNKIFYNLFSIYNNPIIG